MTYPVFCHLFRRPECQGTVELPDASDCPHCHFVHQFVVITEPGEVSFVCRGEYENDIRKVTVMSILPRGGAALMCVEVTAELAEAELAELTELTEFARNEPS